MKYHSRRTFLRQSSALAGFATIIPSLLLARSEERLPYKIGFQTWTVRKELESDFTGTLKKMKAMGFESLEL